MSDTTPDISKYFNRGPLTTTFTPPTSCLQTVSSAVYYVNNEAETTTFYGHWWTTGIQCLPTGTVPRSLLSDATYWGTYWYSPGIYCPVGWATAAQIDGTWNNIDVTGSTSGAICCPSGMGYGGDGHQCTQALSAKDTVTVSSSGVVIASALSTSVTVYADGIPLLWERSDLPKTASATTTTTSESTTSTSSTSSKSSKSSTSSTSESISTPSLALSSGVSSHKTGASSGGGLTEGAKIGIGIGVPVAAIAIGAAIFFFFLRKKRSQNTSQRGRPLVSELPHSEPSELNSEERAPLPEMA